MASATPSSAVAAVLRKLLPSRSVDAIHASAPWVEIVVGILACLAYDSVVVRTALCALFTLFFILLVAAALRAREFDCGCFGTARVERREIILLRGAVGVILAWSLYLLPPSKSLSLPE